MTRRTVQPDFNNGTWPPQLLVQTEDFMQTSSFEVPLRLFRYFVGVYFPKPVITDTYNATVHFRLSGDICEFAGTFWNGNTCSQATRLPGLNKTFVHRFSPIATNLFYLHVPDLTSEISVEIPELVRVA